MQYISSMASLKVEKKKLPSDYPLISFRSSAEQKAAIDFLIEKAIKLYNKGLGEDQKVFKKNDIGIEALKLGLATLINRKL